MQQAYNFPNNKKKALIFSFDDGEHYDRKLADMLRKHKMPATFFLITGQFGLEVPFYRYGEKTVVKRVTAKEVPKTYYGMEVASHTENHKSSIDKVQEEIIDSVNKLSNLWGKQVTGIAWPGGNYTKKHIEILKRTEIRYARTAQCTYNLKLPKSFLEWHPTCKYNDTSLSKIIKEFLQPSNELQLLHIMGHSYELTQQNENSNWDYFGKVLKHLSSNNKIWYTTCGEFSNYLLSQ